ncbi:ATP-grasp domain-containing protein [Streptodolium elevatio]|uniref:ATP-grasp domain-containing protein n=1 Tax=Streptodolium elevatio TaxID=3157996 RepID=A0ABV3DCL9_9ACTN
MGHLLVVESWVGAMSTLLPRAIREAGHTFTFATRDLGHYLQGEPGAGGVHPLLSGGNVVTTETNDLAQLLETVERLHGAMEFDGVLSSCDYYLPATAAVAARLGLPGASVQAVERACRKDRTRAAMDDAGLPGPRYAVTEGWRETAAAARGLGYPLVVKPVDLCAGMFVREVADESQLLHSWRSLADFPVNARHQERVPLLLLEEVLDGPEVSVETVTWQGHTHVVGITDKSLAAAPWFVESGHMFPADLGAADRSATADAAIAALAAVGYEHGVAHTEFRLTAAGPRLVEINPRPAGNRITELVRRVTGVDLPMAAARLALGEKPELAPADTGVRSAAVSFLLPELPGTLAASPAAPDPCDAPDVVEWQVKPAGTRVGDGRSNNHYLGHVMVLDRDGAGARTRAEELLRGVSVEIIPDPEPAAA